MLLCDDLCVMLQFSGTLELAAIGPPNIVFGFAQYLFQALQIATLRFVYILQISSRLFLTVLSQAQVRPEAHEKVDCLQSATDSKQCLALCNILSTHIKAAGQNTWYSTMGHAELPVHINIARPALLDQIANLIVDVNGLHSLTTKAWSI